MDEVWKDFEINCTNYLNSRFGAYAKFTHLGAEDSTHPDILVETNTGKSFYIDAKHSPAQCGQFVLLPNIATASFDYSPRNVNRLNAYAQVIMRHMNTDFDSFREAGTAGKDIILPDHANQNVFSNWVIDTYSRKGTKFFITNDYIILPIEHFQAYFNISAKYRIKRSGSSAVGHARHILVRSNVHPADYSIQSFRADGDKLFVTSAKNIHNQRFILDGYEYMFSQRGAEYEIRKLSNTYNANVIFSIEKKPDVVSISDAEFIHALI